MVVLLPIVRHSSWIVLTLPSNPSFYPPGLEGEPLNDYLHNLRMLCGEDPNNDMVNPPQQSMPGIEAILGALQAQGTNPQQQQFLQAAAVAARSQNQQQLNLQLRNAGLNNLPGATQQALAQQRLGQQVNAPRTPACVPVVGPLEQGLAAGYLCPALQRQCAGTVCCRKYDHPSVFVTLKAAHRLSGPCAEPQPGPAAAPARPGQ